MQVDISVKNEPRGFDILGSLPRELVSEVIQYLKLSDVRSLKNTSRAMRGKCFPLELGEIRSLGLPDDHPRFLTRLSKEERESVHSLEFLMPEFRSDDRLTWTDAAVEPLVTSPYLPDELKFKLATKAIRSYESHTDIFTDLAKMHPIPEKLINLFFDSEVDRVMSHLAKNTSTRSKNLVRIYEYVRSREPNFVNIPQSAQLSTYIMSNKNTKEEVVYKILRNSIEDLGGMNHPYIHSVLFNPKFPVDIDSKEFQGLLQNLNLSDQYKFLALIGFQGGCRIYHSSI